MRVAILDDNPDETASLQAHFSDLGFDVETFTSVSGLVGQLKVRPFDGYVLDWVLNEGSPAELIGMIRAEDSECPIAILTGKMRDDVMIEPAVAGAVSTYKLLFFEKPTRLPIISAQMLQAWGRLATGAGYSLQRVIGLVRWPSKGQPRWFSGMSAALIETRRVSRFGPGAAARLSGEVEPALDGHVEIDENAVIAAQAEQRLGRGRGGGYCIAGKRSAR